MKIHFIVVAVIAAPCTIYIFTQVALSFRVQLVCHAVYVCSCAFTQATVILLLTAGVVSAFAYKHADFMKLASIGENPPHLLHRTIDNISAKSVSEGRCESLLIIVSH